MLEKLKVLKKYDIAQSTEDLFFKRGEHYFNDQALLAFSWKNEGQVLVCLVQGTFDYTVHLRLNNRKQIVGECSCPVGHREEAPCKHEVCALLTIVDLFKNPQASARNQKLYQQLVGKTFEKAAQEKENTHVPTEPKDFSIHLFKNEYLDRFNFAQEFPVSMQIFYKGARADSQKVAISKYLSCFQDYLPFNAFFEAFKLWGEIYHFFLHQGNEQFRITSKTLFSCNPEVTFDLVDNKNVSIQTGVQDDAYSSERLILVGPSLLFNPKNGQFGLFADQCPVQKTCWQYPYELLHFSRQENKNSPDFIEFSSKQNVIMPVERFNARTLKFSLPDQNSFKNYIFKIDGVAVQPTLHSPAGAVAIRKDAAPEEVTIQLQFDSDIVSPLESGFVMELVTDLIQVLPSKKKEIRFFVYNAIVCIVESSTQDDHASIIREIFEKCKAVTGRLNRIQKTKVTHAIKAIEQACLYGIVQALSVQQNRFQISTVSFKQALSLVIACVKAGITSFEKNQSYCKMILPEEEVFKNLFALKSELEKQTISLSYEGKIVQKVKLDFNLTLEKNNDIDWFQIKPEILCQGILLSPEEWQKILDQMGVSHRNGVIQLIDDESLLLLKKIFSYVDPHDNQSKRQTREVFTIPRLQIFDLFEMRQMGAKLTLPKRDEELVTRLLTITSLPQYEQSKYFNGVLRDYQKVGYDWLGFLYEHRFGACLADDMGLGKTIQTIAFLSGIEAKNFTSPFTLTKPHLVVVPPSLLFNWQHEFSLFYPSCKLYLYHGATREFNFQDADVVLTTYDMVRSDTEQFEKQQFHVIVFDEAQAIKNIYTKRTGAVRKLNGLFKICLTGTPLENHIGEYYSIMDLALPGLFPDYKKFAQSIKNDNDYFLLKRSKPFVLRRTKHEILKDLPAKIESDVYLEMQPSQKSLYARTVAQVKNLVIDAYESKTTSQAGIIALTALLRLRQICITGELINKDISEPSPKIMFLIDKIKELKAEGHAALVFSQFTSALDVVEKYFKQDEIEYLRLDGSTPVAQRSKIIKNFQVDQVGTVMLLSLKAGGVGLNLTRASYVFHLDPWWNPAVENQASDRAHRIGQRQQVIVTRLVMHDSIEEKMMLLKQRKAKIFEAIMSVSSVDAETFVPSITKEDFEFLLG